MARDANDFGLIDRLQASSVGLPGQRTFRLQFINDDGRGAALWIEKEQLQALGTAVDQLLAQLAAEQEQPVPGQGPGWLDLAAREPEPGADPDPSFLESPEVEFRIGRLALGYDEARARFTLLVHDLEGDQEGTADFRCMVTREQLRRLSRQIEAVVAAGRPTCPLCGTPLSAGTAHFCPPSNGHAPVQLEE